MIKPARKLILGLNILFALSLLLAPLHVGAQAAKPASSDRWIHVRVDTPSAKGEMVRINVPLELAEKILPAINKDRLHGGRVRINQGEMNDVDLRAIMDAIRSSKDGEFVTVQKSDGDVRVAKQGGNLLIHVTDTCHDDKKGEHKNHVEIKVPMKVVDALFSAGKDELDLVAALHVLAALGDTELVSVKGDDNTVRVWVDSKNVSD